ncbi:hypothetical protein J1605_001400 [Eschrichtius robustus]|uniref:Small ribosomal subunit protein uS10 domain-containing protein n=1 Tax=Eschrichtius robustus TaxID=9764 RepID=A0AB34I5Q0_ESCRO|nr:hypothetical protein J1605_001400 [Eschrichtius robustus]
MLRNPALELEQGTSLAVQWLRLHASIAGGTGSIPGRELRPHMPHDTGKKFKNKIKIELEQDWVSCLVSSEEVKYPSYALPTKTVEVLQLQDQGSKMLLDSVLTTHERVVQISGLSATFAEIFLEIIQSNLPEGVKLSVREHTEEDFKGRFKARPELEELLAKLN